VSKITPNKTYGNSLENIWPLDDVSSWGRTRDFPLCD